MTRAAETLRRTGVRFLLAMLAMIAAQGCVSFPPAPTPSAAPRIDGDRLIVRDGAKLGLTVWRAKHPKAVILAVHGMNDYAHAFEGAAEYWSQHAEITVYAYDQRGFGRSPDFGRWPGAATLEADLIAAIAAVRADNPGKPLFVLGHSMGAAVVMAAADHNMLDVDGVILAAPAVWGGSRLPIPYRIALNVAASLTPGKTLTGERAKRQATDNIPILREMLADPLVIKPTRLDAVLGVVRLMGKAYGASDEIGGRVLFLYGEKDQIIPLRAMKKTAQRLCGAVDVKTYPDGWHLLFRDLEAERVWRDVAAWIGAAERRQKNSAGPKQRFGPAEASCIGAGRESQRAVAVRRPGLAVRRWGGRDRRASMGGR